MGLEDLFSSQLIIKFKNHTKQSIQKNIKLIKSITRTKDKAYNKIIIISPNKIISNRKFIIIKIKNINHIKPLIIKRTLKNKMEIELDLIQQLQLLVSRLRMNFQELQITLTLQKSA